MDSTIRFFRNVARGHPHRDEILIRAAVQDGLHDAYWRERSTLKVVAWTAA